MGQEASLPADADAQLEEQATAPPSSVQPSHHHHKKPHKKALAQMFTRAKDKDPPIIPTTNAADTALEKETIRAGVSSGNVYNPQNIQPPHKTTDDFLLQKMPPPKVQKPTTSAASKMLQGMKHLSIGGVVMGGVVTGNGIGLRHQNKQQSEKDWETQWDEDDDDDDDDEPMEQQQQQSHTPHDTAVAAKSVVPAAAEAAPPVELADGWEADTSSIHKPNVNMFLPMLRVLGKGSFGKVVLVQKREGKEQGALFAMKILKKTHLVKRRQIERTRTERKVLSVVNHPFIMKLHYAFQSPEKLYLVLDYCPGGELFFHLSRFRRFPERVARFYAAELLLAIGHLHKRGIIYRDLKPENVLLDAEGHVKLGDFGLAKAGVSHPYEGASSMCGTPEYMAPEVLQQLGHGFCVDYWGLGMIVYEMMTGLPPWYTTDRQQLFRRLKSAPLDIPSYFSAASADCVSNLLQRNPRRRLGVDGIRVAMEHDFFRNIRWRALYSRKVEAPVRPCEGWKGAADAESLEAATQNFDAQFTRMPVDSEDNNAAPHDSNEEKELMDELDENTFLGFSFDIVKDRETKEGGGAARSRTQNYHATATADGA